VGWGAQVGQVKAHYSRKRREQGIAGTVSGSIVVQAPELIVQK
jgi:hypothetical protein